ncbi:MAG: choice-of-anchor D domain-containing protein, partial [Bacteroidota bacterium]
TGFSGSFSGTIAAGGSQTLTITFSPTSGVFYNGNITVNSDATGGGNTKPVTGTGVDVPTRIISYSMSAGADFGNVIVGQTLTRTLRISNTGNTALQISSVSYPSGFSGSAGLIIITPGAFSDLDVSFTPSAANAYGGNIVFSSNATSGPGTFAVSGNGVAATRTISLSMSSGTNFGTVSTSQAGSRNLTITNSGNSDLLVSNIIFPSGYSGSFNGIIAAGSSQNVLVTFSPSAAVTYSGNIIVSSNATSGTNTIGVTGKGYCIVTKPTVSVGICMGNTYTFYGRILTTSGTYTDTLRTTGACDTVRVLSLTVNNPFVGASLPTSDAGNFGQKHTYNGHNYYISNSSKTWEEASTYAALLGGHLVSVSSAAENLVVISLIQSSVTEATWLGGTDKASEGTWLWTDGTPFNYSNWSFGQPDNYLGIENYLHISRDNGGVWNDLSGSEELTFIVEYDQTSFIVTSNSPLPVGDTLKLTATTLTGATYAWRGPNSFSSTQQNPSISNTQLRHAGKYYLTTTANGCTHLDSVTVVINCVPFVKPTVSVGICPGNTYNFYGRILTTSGTYTDTLRTTGACDTVRVLSLTVNNPFAGGVLPASEAGNFGQKYTYNGHNYYASTVLKNWTDARDYAQSIGAHLVSITDAAENAFVVQMVRDINAIVFIGGSDIRQTNNWEWVTGEAFTFSSWDFFQPDGFGIQDYIVIRPEYNFNWDNDLNLSYQFIIEYDNLSAPIIATSNSPISTGDTLKLTATTLTGATYAWSGPNSFASTQQNPRITNAQLKHAGKYYLTTTA